MKTLIVLIIILVSVATTPLTLKKLIDRPHRYGTGPGTEPELDAEPEAESDSETESEIVSVLGTDSNVGTNSESGSPDDMLG